MSNELVETPPETQTIGEEVTQPEVVAPDATDGAEKPTEPVKTPEQIEIERLRRALTKRDRTQGKLHQEREQLSAELERLRQQPAQRQTQEETATPDLRQVVEREAMTLAEQIAARREFDAKCNTVAEAGKKDFTDFSESLSALIEEAGPLVDQKGTATALGEQILEAESPAKLIHYLGKHPEIAAELDGLTHARLARKLVAIEHEMAAQPKTSAAPKPLEPVSAKAVSKEPHQMTDKEFAQWRKNQIAQRR